MMLGMINTSDIFSIGENEVRVPRRFAGTERARWGQLVAKARDLQQGAGEVSSLPASSGWNPLSVRKKTFVWWLPRRRAPLRGLAASRSTRERHHL